MDTGMFKFVNSNTESINKNSKRPVPRACDACRRRKKRCFHQPATPQPPHSSKDNEVPPGQESPETSNSSPDGNNGQGINISERAVNAGELPYVQNDPIIASENTEQEAVQMRNSRLRSAPIEQTPQSIDSRFIGDMNPEGVFLAATSPQQLRSTRPRADIGFWLTQNTDPAGHVAGASKHCQSVPPTSLFYGLTSPLQQVFLPLLEKDCLSTRPPAKESAALCSFYLEKFHPVLPVIDLDAYQSLTSGSPAQILLQQGMCLVASRDHGSGGYLYLPGEDAPLSCEHFGQRILASMRILIELSAVTDKITLIRALLLMWHFTGSGQNGELSSFIVGKAVQYVISLGLHVQQRHQGPDESSKDTLFCCVWAADRLNAMIHGRPTLLHERDVGRSLQECFVAQKSSFRLLLDVVILLDHTIALYRPNREGREADEGFDLFDDILTRYETSQIPVTHLVTVEILYHVVAILSCRHGGSDLSQSNPDPSNFSRTRQAFSASRVTAMLGQECWGLVTFFPFVPYAVSLCLSVAYRDMRRSKIPVSRARARLAFEENCGILDKLGASFGHAASMAKLGRLTMIEMDKVFSNIADESRRSGTAQQTMHSDSSDGPQPSFQPLENVDAYFDRFGQGASSNLLSHPEMFEMNLFDMFTPSFDLDQMDACLEGNLELGIPNALP